MYILEDAHTVSVVLFASTLATCIGRLHSTHREQKKLSAKYKNRAQMHIPRP
jgi:hypothetical protein